MMKWNLPQPTPQPEPLFSPGKAEGATYSNLRNEVNTYEAAGKRFSERLWNQFWQYADPNFLTDIRKDFHARFWEMYLTCVLLDDASRLGYQVSCPKPGPDILITHEKRRLWVEAVVATDGDPSRTDSAVEVPSGEIPDNKIILRLANAIDVKHKKYIKYRKSGIVDTGDAYVIAINGYPLRYRWVEPELPRILKALFPIGASEVLLDRATGQPVEARYQFRPTIKKASGEKVSTEIFVDAYYQDISAVVYSRANPYSEAVSGVDFQLVHNPLALQPLPFGLMPAGDEYVARLGDHTCELTRNDGAHHDSR